MCDECQRREAKDYWKSLVQVRQKVWLVIKLVINFKLSFDKTYYNREREMGVVQPNLYREVVHYQVNSNTLIV